MRIDCNQVGYDLKDAVQLGEFLAQLGLQSSGIAVAVNGSVIARSRWDAYALQDGDHVLVIRAAQGG